MANSDQFLNAYSQIEKYAQKFTKKKHLSFYKLLEYASQKSPAIKEFMIDLQQYAELRNAIVHKRRGGRVIAEPNSRAVEDIVKLARLITKPPPVIQFFKTEVKTLDISDNISIAVRFMKKHSFSQIPIMNKNNIKALLTPNTITRWLGENVDDDLFSLEDTKISSVLRSTEDKNNHEIVEKNTNLFQILDFYRKFEKEGKNLEAIIITESGRRNQKPMGILTLSDLPKVFKIISLDKQ